MKTEADRVIDIFTEISLVPRKSGNREPMKDWLVARASRKGFRTAVDGEMNVVIYVPASPGREKDPAIALQAHTDMVCVADAGTGHDFEKEAIALVYDGDWLTADGTSLGADNGMGLAMALACAEEPELSHPPMEVLATVDEEIGLLGAAGLDVSLLKSRKLVNLDGETEGDIIIGCAGVMARDISVPGRRVPVAGGRALRLSVSGFRGGHSAADVDKGRGNAVRELARGLLDVLEDSPFRLAALEGGSAFNAIPREAEALVVVQEPDVLKLEQAWAGFGQVLGNEYGSDEPAVACESGQAGMPGSVFDDESTGRLLRFLALVPDGLLSVDRRDRVSPETSSNLGVVETAEDGLKVEVLIRSSIDSRTMAIAMRLDAATRQAGGRVDMQKHKVPWSPVTDSLLQAECLRLWNSQGGREGRLKVIHGGVECGVLANRIPGLDTVSIGADIEDLHSPDERVSLSSVARVYRFLRTLLEQPG